MLTDKDKFRLLMELYQVDAAYDLLLGAANGYRMNPFNPIEPLVVSNRVLHYLAKRNLVICLQLSESEIARHATLRTARQLGYSEQALRQTI